LCDLASYCCAAEALREAVFWNPPVKKEREDIENARREELEMGRTKLTLKVEERICKEGYLCRPVPPGELKAKKIYSPQLTWIFYIIICFYLPLSLLFTLQW
jgi:hypothetical protein